MTTDAERERRDADLALGLEVLLNRMMGVRAEAVILFGEARADEVLKQVAELAAGAVAWQRRGRRELH